MSLCVGKAPVEVRSGEIIFHADDFEDESKNNHPSKRCSRRSTRRDQTENNSVTFPKLSVKSGPSSRRQRLELNVSNMEIEESLCEDEHKEMLCEYNQMENILEACLYFVNAMLLETKTSSRLRRQIGAFFKADGGGTPKVSDEQEVSFEFGCKVKAQIYSMLEKNAIVDDLLSELDYRTDDFKIASRNFRMLLKSIELNDKQLDRLQKQYEKIVSNYRHTRWTVNQQVPHLIRKRKCGLLRCLKMLGEELEKFGDERVKVVEFFRSVESQPTCAPSIVLNKQISDSDLVSRSRRNDGFALKSCSFIE